MLRRHTATIGGRQLRRGALPRYCAVDSLSVVSPLVGLRDLAVEPQRVQADLKSSMCILQVRPIRLPGRQRLGLARSYPDETIINRVKKSVLVRCWPDQTGANMKWWIYKCNSRQHEHQRVSGDWRDLWAKPKGRRWGTSEDLPALKTLSRGDLIIAYQTDRNELVGLARVTRSCAVDTHLYLQPIEAIGAKVKPLKLADPAVARIPALQPGLMRTLYPISSSDAKRLLSAAREAAATTQPPPGPEEGPRYWLFQIMEDRLPGLWQVMLDKGVAAQHYPEGWTNETRNINRLRQLKPGDFVLAAFTKFRFGGYGRLESVLQRSGPSLEVRRPSGGTFAFRERFRCSCAAVPGGRSVDCQALKQTGLTLAMEHGFAVTETTRPSFERVREHLDKAGAALGPGTHVAAPVALDIDEPPRRVVVEIGRVVRDTKRTRALKAKYGFACQICGTSIQLQPGHVYAEVHHLRPLGGKHSGPDVESNMLVLCPNHHAAFDFGVPFFVSGTRIRLGAEEFSLRLDHQLSPDHVAYHNRLHEEARSLAPAT